MSFLQAAAVSLLYLLVAIDAGGFPATLADPTGSGPVVVMAAGSGPTSRDGDSPLGINASYLRKLAEGLAGQGIASLRYDKRGVKGSIALGPEEAITIATFADDLMLVLDWLATTHPGRPVLLLGHSEGGLVTLAAAKSRSDIAGMILLATPGLRPGDTLRSQLERLDPALRDAAMDIVARLERGERVDGAPPALAALFRPSAQPFLISLFAIDPAAELAALGIPALVIGGGRDLQVTRADFDRLAGAGADVTTQWFETMNHVLVDAPEDFAGNAATYARPELVLTEGLVEAVARFVRAVTDR